MLLLFVYTVVRVVVIDVIGAIVVVLTAVICFARVVGVRCRCCCR